MAEAPEDKLEKLREQVRRGEYTIDPDAVAEAVLERLRLRSLARQELDLYPACVGLGVPQNTCSYPESDPEEEPAPDSLTPVPARTRPIQVRRPPRVALCTASSIVLRAAMGAQMQSS